MAGERVWVWLERAYDVQHLTDPPDATTMSWPGRTACALEGELVRVTFENVDNAKACPRCTAEPYVLAGDDRGLP